MSQGGGGGETLGCSMWVAVGWPLSGRMRGQSTAEV